MPERLPDEIALFSAALEMSAEGRATFLEQECGQDRQLRARIESYLRAHEQEHGPLDAAPPEVAETLQALVSTDRVGEHVGPYKLIEKIGEGGMGVVYMAEQTQPVRRTVALKIIKPGMDTRQVVARFDAERQALALMGHANIAKVLDAGATESKRPYFVMELVRGVPITEFCDQHKLSMRKRMELFVTVCEAVQHAHQKGVIHRDLKPSNILVELHDVTPVPKIIDFGVAKAINQQLTEQTLHTGFSQMIGTPLYMSPEQAQLSGMDVDTRSDVYTLGVLLYELLSGTTPFDPDTLRSAGYDELRRRICEDEPPRPSARVSTLGVQDLSTVSEKRRIDPRKLSSHLHGELDWIVMKALEKDRARRYESASALAADVRAFLKNETVVACPPSVGYQLRKFSVRHKGILAAAVLVSASLAIGAAVSVWQAFEAHAARQLADDRFVAEELARATAEHQREVAQLERKEAQDQRKQALENLQLAVGAVQDMYTRLATRWLGDDVAPTDTELYFLTQAAGFYEAILANTSSNGLDRMTISELHRRLARVHRELRNLDKAGTALDKAIQAESEVLGATPDDEQIRSRLASDLALRGRLLVDLGQYDLADRSYAACLGHYERLKDNASDPVRYLVEDVQVRADRALLLVKQGKLEEAQRIVLDTRDRYAMLDQRDAKRSDAQLQLANSGALFSRVLRLTDHLDEAEQICRRALKEFIERNQLPGDRRDARWVESRLHGELAEIHIARGDHAAAVPILRHVLTSQRQLLRKKRAPEEFFASMFVGLLTDIADRQRGLQPDRFCDYIETQQRLATSLRHIDRPFEAEITLFQTVLSSIMLSESYPDVLRYRVARSNAYSDLGMLFDGHRPVEADHARLQAATVLRETVERSPGARTFRSGLRGTEPDLRWFLSNHPAYDFTDTDRAEVMQKRLQNQPSQPTAYERALGITFLRMEQWRHALSRLRTAAARHCGGDVFDWLYLTRAYWHVDERAKAAHYYEKAVQWIQDNPRPHEEVLELYEETVALLGPLHTWDVEADPPAGVFDLGKLLAASTSGDSLGCVLNGENLGDLSGYSVCAAGDVNGDGVQDLVIGAPHVGRRNDEKKGHGAVYVVFGQTNGFPNEIELSSLDGITGFTIHGGADDYAGSRVSAGGDLNHDGIDDLVICAPGAEVRGKDHNGQVYVVFGRNLANGRFPATFELESLLPENGGDGSAGFVIHGIDRAARLGARALSSGGDMNGDGIDDVAIASGKSGKKARMFVLFGHASTNFGGFPPVFDCSRLLPENGGDGTWGIVIEAPSDSNYFGYSASLNGDINGDGLADLAIGGLRSRAKSACVIFGRDTKAKQNFPPVLEAASLYAENAGDGTIGMVIEGLPRTVTRAVEFVGDLNGDGLHELAIGDRNAVVDGKTTGQCYIIFGNATFGRIGARATAIRLAALDGSNGFAINGAQEGDGFGEALFGAGDLNGDGFDDLLVSAPAADPNQEPEAGMVYLLLGNASFPPTFGVNNATQNNRIVFHGMVSSDHIGNALAVGDLNDDAVPDIVIGARNATVGKASPLGSWNEGRTYVLLGQLDITRSGTEQPVGK